MTWASMFSIVLSTGAVLGGIGYAVGQFISARRKGIADSLGTALDEIEVIKARAARLETELFKQAQEMGELKGENATLRSVLGGGSAVIEALTSAKRELEVYIVAEHEKTRALIERIRGERGDVPRE